MATMEGADPAFASKVQALIAASGGRVRLVSGVRSNARQTQLWNAALKKYGSVAKARKWVAPPGRSNHEKGRAVDLGGDLNLAARLAPQFGLYRPLGNEPWHFEPVGSRGKGATSSGGSGVGGAVAGAAKTIAQAGTAVATSAAPPSLTPDPNDRRNLGTQIGALLAILDKPVDFSTPTAEVKSA